MIPPTRRYYLHYILHRLARPRSWRGFITGNGRLFAIIKMRLLKPKDKENVTANPEDERVRIFLKGVYARAIANKVQLLCVLTGAADTRQSDSWSAASAASVSQSARGPGSRPSVTAPAGGG